MNYQEKVELEDRFIETNGQHPLWEYERQIIGEQNISYQKFLQEVSNNSNASAKTSSVEDVVEIKGEHCITEQLDEVILTPAIGTLTPKEERPVIRFESFSNIDLDLIKRTSKQLGQHSYQLYKQIRFFCVPQWKNDSKAFFTWLDKELHYSEGKKLIRLNHSEPYGPDNCMLSGDLKTLYEPINEKHSTDFAALYNEMSRQGKFNREWSSIYAFLHWIQHHEYELPNHVKIERIDDSKAYSPLNCRFVSGTTEIDKAIHPVSIDEKIKIIIHLGERCGVNPYNKYKILVQKGDIIAEKWPLEDYLDWAIEKGVNGELAPYLKRPNRSAPYSPGNAYFSWKQEGTKHGMSNTKLYNKYIYLMRRYRERILPENQLTFEEFMEIALTEKDYQLNSRMRVHFAYEYISMDNIEFIAIENNMDDIIRICSLYQAIPKEQRQFGGLMNFMEWTIRQGYQPWMEFRKIGPECYSPKTCAWDVFTEEGYIASKGMRALRVYNRDYING